MIEEVTKDKVYDEGNSEDKWWKVISIFLLLSIIILLLIIFTVVSPKKFGYSVYNVDIYQFELSNSLTWTSDKVSDNYLKYTGSLNGIDVCVISICKTNEYDTRLHLVEEVHEYYSSCEDYSGLSSVFTIKGYDYFDGIYLDGSNMQVRVYGTDTYISIIWTSSLDFDRCIKSIEKLEDN